MSVDIFLKIDDINGESVVKGHEREIDVLSWDWGMAQSGSMHVATGGGSGKVNVRDMTLVKHVDRASANLFKHCCSGEHFRSAILTVRKAGGSPVNYLKVEMKDVIISSFNSIGNVGGDTMGESVSLNFARYKLTYTPQNPDGSSGAEVIQGWDIAKNTTFS